jgi:hypothetical protein
MQVFANLHICMVIIGISQESVRVAPIDTYIVKNISRWQYWSMHQSFVKIQDNILSSQDKLYHVLFGDSLS